jgi:hypothetical protein
MGYGSRDSKADQEIAHEEVTLGAKKYWALLVKLIGSGGTVIDPLTDTQLRAAAVPVSAASLPLPAGAATAAKQPALGTAGTASTDVITVQGIGSGVPQPVQGVDAAGATATAKPVAVAGLINTGTPSAMTTGQNGPLWLDSGGGLNVTLEAGRTPNTFLSGPADGVSNSGNMFQFVARPMIYNGATLDREVKANATSRLISSAASTNATSAKASAGNVHKVRGRNVAATVIYLKLYNKASAPTVGTDTPVQTFALDPASSFTLDWVKGRYFPLGIAYAFTTGGADADTGAVAAGDILGFNLDYS